MLFPLLIMLALERYSVPDQGDRLKAGIENLIFRKK